MGFEEVHGAHPEHSLAIGAGRRKSDRTTVWRQHRRTGGISGQIERGFVWRIDNGTNRLLGASWVVKKYRGGRAQEKDRQQPCRPDQPLTPMQRFGRCGLYGWRRPVSGNPLQLKFDIVRGFVAIL